MLLKMNENIYYVVIIILLFIIQDGNKFIRDKSILNTILILILIPVGSTLTNFCLSWTE
jgi:hypothetical protein